jgi:HK97 family phage major capsid protein
MDVQTKLTRSFTLERANSNIDERTIEFSFSSEYPVERRNGMEILSHREGEYDFTHLNDQAPLLLAHDQSRQIGKIISGTVRDGVGYCTVQFSRSQEGQEVLNDVIDGIRSKVSVGYSSSNPKLERRDGDVPVYRYTWTPFEVSIVAIPADPSVGIGRSEAQIEIQTPQEEVTQINERTQTMNKIKTVEDAINAIETATPSAEVEQLTRDAKVSDIETLCSKLKLEDEIDGLVARSATLEEATEYLLAIRSAKWKETTTKTRASAAPAVHTRKQDPINYGKAVIAAASGNWKDAGFEREQSQELARQAGKPLDNNSFYIDTNATRVTPITANGATSTGFGKEMVGTQFLPDRLINAVWNQTFLNQVGADFSLSGLTGNVAIPVITSNGTASFVAENTDIGAAQELATAQKGVSPKLLATSFAYSKQMLVQGLPNIESQVLSQIFNAISQKLDAAALSNASLSTLGLLNDVTAVQSLGTNGAVPNLAALMTMQKTLVNAATFGGDLKYLTSGSGYFGLQTVLKDSANTASGYILNSASLGTDPAVGGLPLVWSQNVPNNLTKGTGTNLSAIILGNWSDFAVAQWGGIEVQVDPYTQGNAAQIVVRSFSFWDMLIKRLASFTVIKDAIL